MKRPGVFVGLLVFAVMVYIVLNTLRTEGPGSRGVQEGTQLPPFAMPRDPGPSVRSVLSTM